MRFKSFLALPTVSLQDVDSGCVCHTDINEGFAVVGEYEDAHIMEAQKAAFEQMLSWLKSH